MSAGPGSAPTGREIRRWTAQRRRARAPIATADSLADAYNGALAITLAVAMTLAGAQALGADLTAVADSDGQVRGLDPFWLVLLAGLAAYAASVGLAARLGPVAVSPTRALWWLPLPVDRRGLLRPQAWTWPAVGAALGCVIGAAVILAAGAARRDLIIGGTLAGGAVLGASILAVALAQSHPSMHRRMRRGADVVLGLGPIVVLALAAAGLPAPVPGASTVIALAAIAGLAAVGLAVCLDRRLERLPDRSLREGGAVATGALGATLSVDARAISRSLSLHSERPDRPSRRLALLRRTPRPLAASLALVTAEVLLLLRERRRAVQIVAAACLPLLALAVAAPLPALVLVLFTVGASLASLTGAEGARRAEAAPMLDALLPLSARAVRALRLLPPVLTAVIWAVPVHLALAWRAAPLDLPAAAPWWLAIGILAAPAWAAGAVRGAYRPPQPEAGQLVHTPMGSFDPTLILALLRGPDLALLCAVPSLLAVGTGSVTVWLVLAQGIGAAIATVVVVYSARR